MKRKVTIFFLSLSGICLMVASIFIWFGYFKQEDAGLFIESEPLAEIYINNVLVGKTPFDEIKPPGDYLIRIKPVLNNDLKYDDFETKISLTSGIKTIIKRTFNENEDYSSGAIVSFEKLGSRDSIVNVISIPDNSRISIDGKVYGFTPIKVIIPAGDHNLTVFSDGYLEKQIPIRVYKGYKLTASVKLSKFSSNELSNQNLNDLTLKPQIRINKTEDGYLIVRSGANTGFPEVGKVRTDEVYDIVESGENGKWYKITLPDEEGELQDRQGWVPADFVTKI